jgi:hypothetical protein
MSKFLPSTAGTKRALTNKVLREIFDHWNEVEEKTGKTRGQMTLTHLFRSEPGNYARLIASLLPRDLIVENKLAEIDDDQIDEMIFRMRERIEQENAARAIEPRTVLELEGTRTGVVEIAAGEGSKECRAISEGRNTPPSTDCERG